MGWLWKHCDSCNSEVGHPEEVDYIVGSVKCEHCGYEIIIDTDVRRWSIETLLERLKGDKI